MLLKALKRQGLVDHLTTDNATVTQVVEDTVRGVLARVEGLGSSVCIIKKAPLQLREKVSCRAFTRARSPKESQEEPLRNRGLFAEEIPSLGLEVEEQKPSHLASASLQLSSRDICALTGGIQECVCSMPAVRPRSSRQALGKPWLLQGPVKRSTPPAINQQLSGQSCSSPGA